MPQSPAQREQVARREAQVLQLKIAGATFEQIGRQQVPPISRQAAERIYYRAMRRITEEDRETARKLEEQRLDRLLVEAYSVLRTPHYVLWNGAVVMRVPSPGAPPVELLDDGPRLAAIDRLLRISESRRKLLGLDAPTRHEHEWTVSEIDRELAKVQAELDALPVPTGDDLTEP